MYDQIDWDQVSIAQVTRDTGLHFSTVMRAIERLRQGKLISNREIYLALWDRYNIEPNDIIDAR